MRMITSISIPEDLQPYVKTYRDKQGNFSDLVCRLLRIYFGSAAMAEPAIAGVIESDLQNQLGTLQEAVVQIKERIDTISALKSKASENQKKTYEKLSTLIEKQFDDRTEIKAWVRECGGATQFGRGIRVRISTIAAKCGIPVEVVRDEVLKRYPELTGYVDDDS